MPNDCTPRPIAGKELPRQARIEPRYNKPILSAGDARKHRVMPKIKAAAAPATATTPAPAAQVSAAAEKPRARVTPKYRLNDRTESLMDQFAASTGRAPRARAADSCVGLTLPSAAAPDPENPDYCPVISTDIASDATIPGYADVVKPEQATRTIAKMQELIDAIQNEAETDVPQIYALTDDLDASETTWTSITRPVTDEPFILDGNGHSVKNLTQSLFYSNDDNDGIPAGSIIQNLNLENVNIILPGCGAIANNIGDATVYNCTVSGTITPDSGDANIGCGGFAANANGTSFIRCTNDANIHPASGSDAGGICRWLNGGLISGCTNNGNITLQNGDPLSTENPKSLLGGLVGYISNANIDSSKGVNANYGKIDGSLHNGQGSSESALYVGGIAGVVHGNSGRESLVCGSINLGEVTNYAPAATADSGAGGIVGYARAVEGSKVSITECVSAESVSGAMYAGGIVGRFRAEDISTGVVDNNYVTRVAIRGLSVAGGIVGINYSDTGSSIGISSNHCTAESVAADDSPGGAGRILGANNALNGTVNTLAANCAAAYTEVYGYSCGIEFQGVISEASGCYGDDTPNGENCAALNGDGSIIGERVITLDPGEGRGAFMVMAGDTVPELCEMPAEEGYEFKGWYATIDGKKQLLTAGMALSGNLSATARFILEGACENVGTFSPAITSALERVLASIADGENAGGMMLSSNACILKSISERPSAASAEDTMGIMDSASKITHDIGELECIMLKKMCCTINAFCECGTTSCDCCVLPTGMRDILEDIVDSIGSAETGAGEMLGNGAKVLDEAIDQYDDYEEVRDVLTGMQSIIDSASQVEDALSHKLCLALKTLCNCDLAATDVGPSGPTGITGDMECITDSLRDSLSNIIESVAVTESANSDVLNVTSRLVKALTDGSIAGADIVDTLEMLGDLSSSAYTIEEASMRKLCSTLNLLCPDGTNGGDICDADASKDCDSLCGNSTETEEP